MRAHLSRRAWVFAMTCCCIGHAGLADPSPVTASGVPPQIVPSAPEVGVTIMQMPGSGTTSGGGTNGGDTGSGGASTGTTAYDAMMATSFGDAAAAAAQQAGISPDALAAFGEVESDFENVPTANGSSSATGPWQITTGTWASTVAAYGLGYSAADIDNPDDQAVVASDIIESYANSVSQATGEPATVLQTYGAYVFGPSAGAQIASADPSAPLSDYVSATALANNNMTDWTVGQFETTMGAKLGSASGETVLGSV
jgi:hypothetical protein